MWQSHLERNDDMSRLVARLRDPSSAVDAKSDAVGTVVISAKEKDGALFIDMKLRQVRVGRGLGCITPGVRRTV